MNSPKLEIRRLAVDGNDLVVAAESSTLVTVWSLKTQSLVNQFDTILEAGGAGIVVSETKEMVIATGYHVGGVASYCLKTGVENWRRPDLIKLQSVSLGEDDSVIYCGSNQGSCTLISSDRGETLQQMDGVAKVWPELSETAMQVEGGIVLVTPSGQRFLIENETFTVLDVCLGAKFLALSDATGDVRVYRIDTGDFECRFPQPVGSHVLKLATLNPTQFVAVRWNYEDGGECDVFLLDVPNQTATQLGTFPRTSVFAFYDSGRKILTLNGATFDCESGKLISTFQWA